MKITKPKRVDKVWGMSYGFTMIDEYCGKNKNYSKCF